MKKKYLFLIIVMCLVIPLISATQIFQQNVPTDLKIQCIINGTYCSGAAVCNVTITNPNGSLLINNKQMSNHVSYHNYTLPNTAILGNYLCTATCCDVGFCGADDTSCDYSITPTGSSMSNSLWVFLTLLGISIVIVVFGIWFGNEYMGFIGGSIMLMSGIYSMVYGIGDLANMYTQTISYVLLGLSLLFLITAGYSAIEGAGLFNRSGAQDEEF